MTIIPFPLLPLSHADEKSPIAAVLVAVRHSIRRSGHERSGRSRRRRQVAVPTGCQTRDTVLRLSTGHTGPGVVSAVPVLLRRVRRRLLDIVLDRVHAQIDDRRRLRRASRPSLHRAFFRNDVTRNNSRSRKRLKWGRGQG